MEPLKTESPDFHKGHLNQTDESSGQAPSAAKGASSSSSKENSDPNIHDLTFKEASTELEGIVRALEAGDMELEQSLVAYRRGVELVKDLSERLEKAEQEVSTLTAEIFPPEASA